MLHLLLRNLLYHRRANLAIFLGVALGAAVLTGALLVGDSLRGSLRALTLDQLGWVEQAMVTPRFFREKLAEEMPGDRRAPAILLQGAAEGPVKSSLGEDDDTPLRRAGKVTLLAVDQRFWPDHTVPVSKQFWQSQDKEVVLNETLAKALAVEVGRDITISVQKADSIPRESLLGKRSDVTQAITLRVKQILPDEGMARFSLKPSPEPVRNAFVPLKVMQQLLDLPERVNAILIDHPARYLHQTLHYSLTLDDWNVRLRTPADRARSLVKFLDRNNKDGKVSKKRWHGRIAEELAKQADEEGILTLAQIIAYYEKQRPYINVESGQMFLDDALEKAITKVCRAEESSQEGGWKCQRVLVYLADTIKQGPKETPYAVVAGVEDMAGRGLGDNQIELAAWPGSPFQQPTLAPTEVLYYVPDEQNQLVKRIATFLQAGFFDLRGHHDDPDLTPEFPGVTDKLDMKSWENPPFPYNAKRIKAADEEYWKRFRTTPKAYVSLAKAQELWGGRFGRLTSVRVFPDSSAFFDKVAEDFERRLLVELSPNSGGFVFQRVKALALQASGGGTDFGVLFLAFSGFLIAAALLLVGLLIRLSLDRRGPEIGVLLATGWSHRQVRRLVLVEGGLLAVVGGLAGLAFALVYADLMIKLLQSRWPGGEGLAFLHFHVQPRSLLIGYSASLVVSFLTIVWATRVLGKMAPRALLVGETTAAAQTNTRSGRWPRWILVSGLLGAVACGALGWLATGHEAKAGSFFGGGALLLTASLAGLALWFRHVNAAASLAPSLTRLSVRNAGRHTVRSLLTVGLLASATFLITAVESFHKEVGTDFKRIDGGSGGFALLAESDVPIYQDLNDPTVRDELKLPEEHFQDVAIFSLRLRAGDDASCLNLYQPLKPRLLGVPARMTQKPRFHFSAGLWTTPEEKANPWKLLDQKTEDGSVPVFADANTAQWILRVGLGKTLETTDDRGATVKLKVVALLQESIFQSELLMAESHFLRLFPRQEGFNFFLIDSAGQDRSAISSFLVKGLGEHGLEVTPTAERLQAYLAVENMYLATFQALGQLGLVLGALGVAIVLLRGVWERRGELALLQALGFRKSALAWLVLAENGFLLAAGLGIGAVTALVAVLPHLATRGGTIVWQRLGMSLGLVVLVGLAAGMAAVASTLRTPILTALRRE